MAGAFASAVPAGYTFQLCDSTIPATSTLPRLFPGPARCDSIEFAPVSLLTGLGVFGPDLVLTPATKVGGTAITAQAEVIDSTEPGGACTFTLQPSAGMVAGSAQAAPVQVARIGVSNGQTLVLSVKLVVRPAIDGCGDGDQSVSCVYTIDAGAPADGLEVCPRLP